ncbi:hypothetical protein VTN77DRAFT_7785 [Rasamsonia byssochlamydoides]|uniref:uncharacterized protein n=1 Tax=Rasamsonia byssochlamydoides TaxID=89139 RepID=UPI0037446DF6
MQRRATRLLNEHPKSPIFHVHIPDASVRTAFEEAFPERIRSQFKCWLCAHFLNRFADLALVDESTGRLLPLFWDEDDDALSEVFREPVKVVRRLFDDRKVTTEFRITQEKGLHVGVKERGGFPHMAFDFPAFSPSGFVNTAIFDSVSIHACDHVEDGPGEL